MSKGILNILVALITLCVVSMVGWLISNMIYLSHGECMILLYLILVWFRITKND